MGEDELFLLSKSLEQERAAQLVTWDEGMVYPQQALQEGPEPNPPLPSPGDEALTRGHPLSHSPLSFLNPPTLFSPFPLPFPKSKQKNGTIRAQKNKG